MKPLLPFEIGMILITRLGGRVDSWRHARRRLETGWLDEHVSRHEDAAQGGSGQKGPSQNQREARCGEGQDRFAAGVGDRLL